MANSPQLANPHEDEKHGKVVFFDILGLMAIVYPESVAIAINYSVVVIVFMTVYFGVRSAKDTDNNGKIIYWCMDSCIDVCLFGTFSKQWATF